MKRKTLGILCIAALAAMTVVFVFFRSFAIEASYPFNRMAVAFRRGPAQRLKGLFAASSAMAENVRLRREVSALSMAMEDAARLEAENQRLRKALGYAKREPGRWIAAPILCSSGGATGVSGVLRAGAGSLDDIVEGAVVAVPEGVVGIVSRVTAHTCEIRPITDASVMVACEIELSNGARGRGVTAGGGEGFLRLEHLKGVEGVSARNRVFTSGRGGVFPRGLEIGSWSEIVTNSYGAVSGEVELGVDVTDLEDVFIRREK